MRDLRYMRWMPPEERFHNSYIPEALSGCWIWIGRPQGSNGYGRIKVGDRHMPAHRYSYAMHVGVIPDGMLVCHRCDVPLCVNPTHLFLGTNSENNADKMRKGRQARGPMLAMAISRGARKGEAAHNNKLRREDVLRIFSDSRPQRAIAADFGVSQMLVFKIKRKEAWSWLLNQE